MLTRVRKPADGPPRKSGRRLDLRRWISPVVLVAAWQVASATGVLPPDKLSSPWTVLRAGAEVARSGELGTAFAVSLGRVGAGFALGAAVGLVLGVLSGLSRWGEALADPPVQMLRTLPFLGLVPLFILWFGIGEETKIALVALGVAFPLYLNVHSGIRSADPDLVDASRALGFTRAERLWHVVLPGALPQALVGLRQSLGIAWLALIVARRSTPTPASATSSTTRGSSCAPTSTVTSWWTAPFPSPSGNPGCSRGGRSGAMSSSACARTVSPSPATGRSPTRRWFANRACCCSTSPSVPSTL